MNDRQKQLAKTLGGLCLTFDREYVPELMEVFDLALADLTITEIVAGCAKWISVTGKRFPTPADVREQVQGDPSSHANVALETLKGAMARSGSYRSVAFRDDALMVAIEHNGGWVATCITYRDLSDKQVSFWEHEFKQIYQQAAKFGRKPAAIYLPGLSEIHNVNNPGFTRGTLPEPMLDYYGPDQMQRVLLAKISPDALLVEMSRRQIATTTTNNET